MAYKQVRAFNQTKAGETKGWCLQNVRLGFGIASKYPNAITAWNNTKGHKNRSWPADRDVPLFYSYKSDGHVNVRLKSGKVWSDGDVYSSLDAYLKAHPSVSYLGWGESINDVAVLKYVPDLKPPKMPKVGSVIQLLAPDARTTFKAGTTKKAGVIHVRDNSYLYTVRGYDKKYPGRVLINSKSAGGDGVALALYYTSGSRIKGWKQA